MLLAGLQREAHRRIAGSIDRDADQPAGQQPLEGILHGDEGGMRPAIAQRHAEALAGADDDIRAHLPGRGQQRQRQRIGGDDGEPPHGLHRGDFGAQVTHLTSGAGVLQQQREGLFGGGGRRDRRRRRDHHADAHGLRPDPHHRQGLRVQIGSDQQRVPLALVSGVRQRDRLGRRGPFIKQRGIGDGQAGQLAHHGLEVHQRFQPPLGDFRLIGGIGRVPAGVFQHVPQDHRRGQRAVITKSDQRLHPLVLLGQPAQLGDRLSLGRRRRQTVEISAQDRRRDGAEGQRIQARRAHHLQHLGDVVGAGANMAANELVALLQRGKLAEQAHARVSTKAA